MQLLDPGDPGHAEAFDAWLHRIVRQGHVVDFWAQAAWRALVAKTPAEAYVERIDAAAAAMIRNERRRNRKDIRRARPDQRVPVT